MIDDDLDFTDEAPPPDPPSERRGRRAARTQSTSLVPAVRPLPHSAEAEEHVLSCCFADPVTIEHCLSRKLTGTAFYIPANRIIFEQAVATFIKKGSAPIEIVAEQLRDARRLEEIGGYPYLMKVSDRAPTTVQAHYFIDRVRDLHALRQLIRLSASAAEKCYAAVNGETTELLESVAAELDGVMRSARGGETWAVTPLMDLHAPKDSDANILMGRYRFLCRGFTGIMVGPSSVGKSSFCFQWAAVAALGRPMLGIQTHGQLRSVIINGEDDDGDVGEVRDSLVAGLQLNEKEIDQVRERVFVAKVRTATGEAFFREVALLAAKHRADLVWINPLLAFVGLDITKPGECAKLRAMLNLGNPDERFAYMLVHHTNKPPGAKESRERNWNEYMYNMTGAADVVNMARVVLSIEAKRTNGEFLIRLAKRGKRAGVAKLVPPDGETSAAYKTEIVTEIFAKHSKDRVTLADGRTLPMILWEASEGEDEPGTSASDRLKAGRRTEYTFADFRPTFALLFRADSAPKGYNALHRAACQMKKVGNSAFNRLLDEAVANGELKKTPEGYLLPNS